MCLVCFQLGYLSYGPISDTLSYGWGKVWHFHLGPTFSPSTSCEQEVAGQTTPLFNHLQSIFDHYIGPEIMYGKCVSDRLSQHLLRAAELTSKSGACSWVTALPINFPLCKSAFRDALCLCYIWTPADLPRQCVCGPTFNTEHTMTCPTGGVTIIWHNDSSTSCNWKRQPCKHWLHQCNCSWSVPWWCGGRSTGSAADRGHRGRSLPTKENQA